MTQTEIIQARKTLAFVELDLLADLIDHTRELIVRKGYDHVDAEKLLRDMLIHEYGGDATKAESWVGALMVLAKAPRRIH